MRKLIPCLFVLSVIILITLTGCATGPVTKYAAEKGLPDSSVKALQPLDEDGVADQNEKVFIDSLEKHTSSGDEQLKLIKLFAADRVISDAEITLLGQPLSVRLIEMLYPLCDGGLDSGEIGFMELVTQYPENDAVNLADLYLPNPRQALVESDLYKSARQYFEAEDYESAIAGYRDLMDQYPAGFFAARAREEIVECYFTFGTLLEGDGKFTEAIRNYTIIVTDYRSSNDAEPAGRAIENCKEQLDALNLYDSASQCRQNKQYEDAVIKYKDFLGKYPGNSLVARANDEIIECYYRLGAQLQQDGRFADAVQKYNIVLAKYEKSSYADKAKSDIKSCQNELESQSLYEAASKYYQLKQYEAAAGKYKELLNRFPYSYFSSKSRQELEDCYYKLAFFQAAQEGRFDEAISNIEAVVKTHTEASSLGREDIIKVCSTILENCFTKDIQVRAAVQMVKNSDKGIDLLLPYLKKYETVVVYVPVIKIGKSGTEDALIEALEKFGYKEMAEDYLNSGNSKLDKAATSWCERNRFIISKGPGSAQARWGRGL